MSKLNALREERGTLAKEIRHLVTEGSGKWTEEHQKAYEEKLARIDELDKEIDREQKALDLLAAETRQVERYADDRGISLGQAKSDAERHRSIFHKWLRRGDQAVTAEEWVFIRNTMSTGVNTEGGYTVPVTVAATFLDALKEFGGMRSAASVIRTSSGEQINYPTVDDTSNVGEIVAENQSATDQDIAFGVVSLPTYKYSSKVVTVPWELLQDSNIDVEALVRGKLIERIGRITNTHFTNGTGTGQPRGIVTGATLGKAGTTGQTTTVTYDDLVDLEHSVDAAYRRLPGVGFMMHDSTVKVLRKIKDGQQRPIFVPSYEQGSPGGAPATLLGWPIIINNDVPEMAADAKSILFGVLSNYTIRDVMSVQLFRFTDSAYTKKGQVGFLAWMRSGGTLTDVGGASVKFYQNSAT